MQEMNFIHLSRPDFRNISNSAILPVQNSRGFAPAFVALHVNDTLPLHSAMDHNPTKVVKYLEVRLNFFMPGDLEEKGLC
jgi:hypothetical protein